MQPVKTTPRFMAGRIARLLRLNLSAEEIAERLSVDAALVRFMEHEWIAELIQGSPDEAAIGTIEDLIRGGEYDVPEKEMPKLLNEREELTKALALRGFTIPQIHVITKLTMSYVRGLADRAEAEYGGSAMDESLPIMPDNLATRLINSIYVSHYKKTRRLLNPSEVLSDYETDAEIEDLNAAVIAWIATREEVRALKLRKAFDFLAAGATHRNFRFSDSYLNLGMLYPTALSLNRAQGRQAGQLDRPTKKQRIVREDRCANEECGAAYVDFPGSRRASAGCPFCDFRNSLSLALKKAAGSAERAQAAGTAKTAELAAKARS